MLQGTSCERCTKAASGGCVVGHLTLLPCEESTNSVDVQYQQYCSVDLLYEYIQYKQYSSTSVVKFSTEPALDLLYEYCTSVTMLDKAPAI